MNKKVIIGVLVVIIVVSVAVALFLKKKDEAKTEVAANQLNSEQTDWPGKDDGLAAGFYEKKIQEMNEKSINEVMPKEIAMKKLKHARNIFFADPSLTPEERAMYVKKIEEVYQQTYGDIPPETPEDKKEQERIKAKTAEFKNSVSSIKTSTTLSREQKETELFELLKKYIADVDKGYTEDDLKAEMEKLKSDSSLSREEKEKKLSGSIGKFVDTNKDKK
jgi:hypothetical protein